jgi:hypothetical protein
MSETNKRYTYDGFTFGEDGDTQLEIYVLKENGYGGWTTRLSVELTRQEREELITFLQQIEDKE